jgi:myo-inositol-1(or 4)-monophosphatase
MQSLSLHVGPKAWGKRTFTAHRNGGAFCNGEAISVSRISKLQQSLLVTGFGYEHDEAWTANMRMFKTFTDKTQGVRRLGAASVDLCHLAMGLVDAYWEYRLKPWDVAAGVLVVEEAGGLVTTMRGTAYSVFERSMLASNDRLHEQILKTTEAETDALLADGIDLGPWFVPKGYRVHSSLTPKEA